MGVKGDPESSERVADEVNACLIANVDGRGVGHAAVSDPGNRAVQAKALDLIHSLASTDDLDDATTLFLCVQLLISGLLAPAPLVPREASPSLVREIGLLYSCLIDEKTCQIGAASAATLRGCCGI
jgi:hypothetical protein